MKRVVKNHFLEIREEGTSRSTVSVLICVHCGAVDLHKSENCQDCQVEIPDLFKRVNLYLLPGEGDTTVSLCEDCWQGLLNDPNFVLVV